MPNTLEENVNRIKAAKTAIGAAITAKGGTVGANDGLEDFASDIASIPSGGGDYDVEVVNSPASFSWATNVKKAILPDGITALNNYLFNNATQLTSVTIPNSVTSIGQQCFLGCISLTNIILPPNFTTLGPIAFQGCTGLTSIEIPNGVTNIEYNAFSSCTGLQYIKFTRNTPPVVGNNAFNNLPTSCIIYVPTGTLSAYTSTANMPSSSTYTYVEY